MTISGRPNSFIHSGNTFMMEDLPVVTPMKLNVGAVFVTIW